ncbi:methylmalonyl-CoA mutase family protein [Williamsia sp. CHRR-6]|uniref:methylmalonyl-CoA mutase family protein n=1 Tax=Williamsia sp. CHRR-6 TaxID=2835871 RepID=UPI001BDA6E03|nr:methylmalonyl-CoA mutase family protein [Williamsia sp. CHRR-6]MBT0568076.1 methylmalonyl-CoA mutase [Williamsia sp. CHRR-6]
MGDPPVADESTLDSSAARRAWESAVAGVLEKSRRGAALPTPPSAALTTTTYDGIDIKPLYDITDELGEPALPGRFPFTRGRDAARDVNRGWHVTAHFGGRGQSATEVNADILDSLATGVSAIWLTSPAGDLPAALDGVLLDLAPLTLDVGSDTEVVAGALFDLLDARPEGSAPAVSVALGADPLTAAFAGRAAVSVDAAIGLAIRAAARTDTVRAITVDGRVFHDAGATEAQQVGAAVAAGVDYVRAMMAAGLDPAAALGQIEFRFAATDAQFETIATFRAARRVWARVAELFGVPGAGDAPQHAVTSAAMMTRRDPWVNMLRTTLGAFGAGVGGADQVTVLPFDAALPTGAITVSRTFADRMAKNTQLLLIEESHLGRVIDPAAGSWYVEKLTNDLAAAAWTFMQQVERAGGHRAALADGSLAEAIAATRSARASDIAHRRVPITGVSEFPDVSEAPLSPAADDPGLYRYAAAFEALRDRSDTHLRATGARPAALLAPLGSIAEYNARTTFTANLLAAGGIVAIDPGPAAGSSADHLNAAAQTAAASVAVICGTDKRYADELTEAVATLRAAGVTRVLVAGSASVAAELTEDRRPDGFLSSGIDAVAALTDILDLLAPPSAQSPATTPSTGSTAQGA